MADLDEQLVSAESALMTSIESTSDSSISLENVSGIANVLLPAPLTPAIKMNHGLLSALMPTLGFTHGDSAGVQERCCEGS